MYLCVHAVLCEFVVYADQMCVKGDGCVNGKILYGRQCEKEVAICVCWTRDYIQYITRLQCLPYIGVVHFLVILCSDTTLCASADFTLKY